MEFTELYTLVHRMIAAAGPNALAYTLLAVVALFMVAIALDISRATRRRG